MNDKPLTSEDRYTISSLRKQGLTATAIAEELVRDEHVFGAQAQMGGILLTRLGYYVLRLKSA